MGLVDKDLVPDGVELDEAYRKVRKWYQANVPLLESRKLSATYTDVSKKLIAALPEASATSTVEMRAVMGEVIYGNLEWAYHESDGEYKMAAYAHEAVKPFGGYSLSESERN